MEFVQETSDFVRSFILGNTMFGKLFRETFRIPRLQCCLPSSKFLDNRCVWVTDNTVQIQSATFPISSFRSHFSFAVAVSVVHQNISTAAPRVYHRTVLLSHPPSQTADRRFHSRRLAE